MNNKIILVLLLVGIIWLVIYKINNPVCGVEKFTGTLHPIHPAGSYKNKCKQIFYDGVRLRALCPNMNNIYVSTQFCTCECPCVDRAGTMELNCGCSTNKYGVNDKGELICEK